MDDIDKLLEIKRSYHETGTTLVKKIIKNFFIENPEIKMIWWNQYTPYFNDGDPCIFRINDFFASGNTDKFDDIEDTWSYDNISKESINALDKLASRLRKVEDVLEQAFGDHCTVVSTPNKIETREYEHD